MKYIASLLTVLLFSCSTIPQSGTLQALDGKYIFIDKRNNFYDELTLRLNRDSTFSFNQRVGPETFEVKGTVSYIKKDLLELTVVDTTTILRKGPIYEFYNIRDTLVVLSRDKVKLNGKKFDRVQ